jgi:hypothetical protein
VLLGLRAIYGKRVMIDATGRGYFVAGKGAGASDIGGEIIGRVNLVHGARPGPHGIGVQSRLSTRDTIKPG